MSDRESVDLSDIDLQSVAESEIPEVRQEARDWLLTNNTSDQRSVALMSLGVLVFAIILQSWWAAVLAGCIALVLPFRWVAGPYFRGGDLRRGILWANLGSWYLLFPLVIIIPETLPIAIQNVIGPVILAATYLERRFVKQLIPGTIAIAVVISLISFTTDGVGLDEVAPDGVFIGVLVAYIAANLLMVMGDIQELNLVHLRSLDRAVKQNRELRAAERALRDSRRRLVVAGDEERVRVERDLHDGAQQRLVSLSMQLRLAADLAADGQPPSSDSLMALHRSANEAVDELRDLAQGLYPARLKELGLVRALHSLARRSPTPIEIDDRTTTHLDDSTQVALYFVCAEAIQNASKHAGAAARVTVTLVDDDPDLVVTITDDGPGFDADDHASSRGLLNMADRVGALGGTLDVDSERGRGTVVSARIPHAELAATS
ncbi:signal transduction histidine kinase [Ilumatobacter fluminis]|uniref:histidine kinase n=1 Tax=Ilumatobacter fluminis TaxID=467091 RepID=A0A4R7HZ91_9ACTN|nr:sensor histidine kinase [Ilumatobacter fluminis]TDT15859.1 signal transduction histidine kinase [Ilumatobacter fluminis]